MCNGISKSVDKLTDSLIHYIYIFKIKQTHRHTHTNVLTHKVYVETAKGYEIE